MAVSSIQLVDNIAVTNVDYYSQAVNMDGANAIQPTVVVTAAGATTLTITLQGSNDLSNWSTITLTSGASWTGIGAGYSTPSAQGSIAFQYVRLNFKAGAAGPLVCSVFLCTSFL
jgi:hypothetical protein